MSTVYLSGKGHHTDPGHLAGLTSRSALTDAYLEQSLVIGDRPTIADISMVGYLLYPKHGKWARIQKEAPFDRRMAQPDQSTPWLALSL